jgi:hypothetical protein
MWSNTAMIEAAIPNNPTQSRYLTYWLVSHPPLQRGFHALWLPVPWVIHDGRNTTLVGTCQRLQLQADFIDSDSKSELFRLHSPLLAESLLFSSPPLTNMLKPIPWSFRLLKRKENSLQGFRQRPRLHLCCHSLSTSWIGPNSSRIQWKVRSNQFPSATKPTTFTR